MTQGLNNDFSKVVVMRTANMDWQESPSRGVWRKRLDLAGDLEKSRVTSIVRYDPASRFSSHPHPDGEEIFVLKGIFSDEHGDYPAGSFLLNPEGFNHAPFSDEGCILFVKLRQYPGRMRRHVTIDTNTSDWRQGTAPGVEVITLYHEIDHPETVELYRYQAGTAPINQQYPKGAEILVLEGELIANSDRYEAGSWLRFPAGDELRTSSEKGTRFYLKHGHLL